MSQAVAPPPTQTGGSTLLDEYFARKPVLLLIPVRKQSKYHKSYGGIVFKPASAYAPTNKIILARAGIRGVFENDEYLYIVYETRVPEHYGLYAISPNEVKTSKFKPVNEISYKVDYCSSPLGEGRLFYEDWEPGCETPDGVTFEIDRIWSVKYKVWEGKTDPAILDKVHEPWRPKSLEDIYIMLRLAKVSGKHAQIIANVIGGKGEVWYHGSAGGRLPISMVEIKARHGTMGVANKYFEHHWDEYETQEKEVYFFYVMDYYVENEYVAVIIDKDKAHRLAKQLEEIGKNLEALEKQVSQLYRFLDIEEAKHLLEDGYTVARKKGSKLRLVNPEQSDETGSPADLDTLRQIADRIGVEIIVEEVQVQEKRKEPVKPKNVLTDRLGSDWYTSFRGIPEWADGFAVVEEDNKLKIYPIKRSKYGDGYYAKKTWRPLGEANVKKLYIVDEDTVYDEYKVESKGKYYIVRV